MPDKTAEQFQQIAYKHRLSPSAMALYQWLRHNHSDDADSLREFNQFVFEHRGKPYHRDTLKRAVNQLEEVGLIRIAKKFCWWLIRLAIRPIARFFGAGKNQQKCDRPRGSQPPNARCAGKVSLQQQPILKTEAAATHLEKQVQITEAAGLKYPEGQREWLLAFTQEELIEAVKYLFKQSGVLNREGFLRRSLEQNWDFYYCKRPMNEDFLQKLGVNLICQ
ncbi:MAG: hypothetical protein ACP5D7_20030 [Limnospira sp.]